MASWPGLFQYLLHRQHLEQLTDQLLVVEGWYFSVLKFCLLYWLKSYLLLLSSRPGSFCEHDHIVTLLQRALLNRVIARHIYSLTLKARYPHIILYLIADQSIFL